MRRSVLDKRYMEDIPNTQVFFNGEKLKHCIEADSSLCTAWVYETDRNGNLVVRDDSLVPVMLYGNVKIKKGK